MPNIDPDKAREFAIEVVRRLHAAGFEALWAGGCVRDQLLEIVPTDYDVATSATPEEVRKVFGRRTLDVGAAFGVIVVLGPRGAGQVEVATFRKDADYSDGRHPDSVEFSDAKEDARRRDFTINGLFYNPLADKIIDYVEGRQDLAAQVIRAIDDPEARFDEDKLRMLRAVRFASRFGFRIDEPTLLAVQRHAKEIAVVSAERIANEMRRMLVLPRRGDALRLLATSRLLETILPEAASQEKSQWEESLQIVEQLDQPTVPLVLAGILRGVAKTTTACRKQAKEVCRRWKLSRAEINRTDYLLRYEETIRYAPQLPWPQLQRVLVTKGRDELLRFVEAVTTVIDGNTTGTDLCHEKLALPSDQVNPRPFITGDDLKDMGIPPCETYRKLLYTVRDEQLEGHLRNRAEALDFAKRLWQEVE